VRRRVLRGEEKEEPDGEIRDYSTISAFVLPINPKTAARSGAGTSKLARLASTRPMKTCQSLSLMPIIPYPPVMPVLKADAIARAAGKLEGSRNPDQRASCSGLSANPYPP
jgi:hypothetical protein